ncbi:hypothetical protein NU219Hw_g446t1 [Hortaea werneckii]
MEPVSLAFTALPVLFETAFKAFGYLQSGKAYGIDVQHSCLSLAEAHVKLRRWGKDVGLPPVTDGPVDLQRIFFSKEDVQHAQNSLEYILILFKEAEGKSAKLQEPRSPSQATDLKPTLPPGPLDPHGRMNEWWRRRQRSTGLFFNKAKWAFYGKDDFETLVARVNERVDSLVELFPTTRQPQQTIHEDVQFAL